MRKAAIFKKLRACLAENNVSKAGELCRSLHPEDLAVRLPHLPLDERLRILSILGHETGADILARMEMDHQLQIAAALDDAELAAIITHMPSDERVDLFKRLSGERGEQVLSRLPEGERHDIHRLGAYAEGTAGSIMSSDYVFLTSDLTVQQALERLRKEAEGKDTIYYIYVIDEQGRLQGLVSLRKLITTLPETPIRNIMVTDLVYVRVEDDQEETAHQLNKYDLVAIPVLDENDVLAGIITFDDVWDVMEEERTEDFHRMAALSHKAPDLTEVNMRDAGILMLVRKRLPWLLVLVFMNIFSGAGIAYFEDTIAAVVSLVFFLPLLIDSGGNAGSQAATLMVRALATGRAQLKDWIFLLGKEVLVALALGLCMGLAVSLVGVFRAGAEVAAVVAVTMVCTVLFGSLVGMSLPFILSKLKMDPATASAPLITSIADIGGVLIYFSIAGWFLRDIIAAAP